MLQSLNSKPLKSNIIFMVIINLLLIGKMVLFNFLIDIKTENTWVLLLSINCILVAYMIASIFMKKHFALFVSIFYTLISVIMFADSVYYKYYNQLPSVSLISHIAQLFTVKESVFHVILPIHFVFIADILPLLAFLYMKSRKKVSAAGFISNAKLMYKLRRIGPVLAAGIISIMFLTSSHTDVFGKDFFTYHLVDIYKTIVNKPEPKIEDVKLDVVKPQDRTQKGKYFGIAKGRNLIVIQMEAFQNFVINKAYNDQEITPNLNKLIQKDSIYFDRYYQQIGRGNTSDAEFITNNSLHASSGNPTYSEYVRRDYYGLPWVLRDNDYATRAFHGYDGTFWNRKNAYPYQGYQAFIDERGFNVTDKIGFGLTDHEFFKQSVPYLKDLDQPFYAFMVTLSSHHPYILPEQYQTLVLKDEHKGTTLGNYLEAVHYVDASIGEFIEELKQAGLYDNSVIALYGDHFALQSYDENNKKFMTEFLGYDFDYDEMLKIPLIIHIPNSKLTLKKDIVGGQIDFMPTVLNLLGVKNEKGIMFGQDLLNSTEGFVAEQMYIPEGSFIDNEKIFIMSKDGVFENSKAWNLQTRELIDVNTLKDEYEKALKQIEDSNYIVKKDLVKMFEEENK